MAVAVAALIQAVVVGGATAMATAIVKRTVDVIAAVGIIDAMMMVRAVEVGTGTIGAIGLARGPVRVRQARSVIVIVIATAIGETMTGTDLTAMVTATETATVIANRHPRRGRALPRRRAARRVLRRSAKHKKQGKIRR